MNDDPTVFVHVDDILDNSDDPTWPFCVRRFLSYDRLAAALKMDGLSEDVVARLKNNIEPELHQYIWTDPKPMLFATYLGKRVRVVMASRLGDVGITYNLKADRVYSVRLPINLLTDFSDSS